MIEKLRRSVDAVGQAGGLLTDFSNVLTLNYYRLATPPKIPKISQNLILSPKYPRIS